MTAQENGDLTVGLIGKKRLLFAVPLLLGSLMQQLYHTVDLIFVGNYIGSSASAAIGASSLLITCLVGFFGGMSVGSGVVIAQLYGAKDTRGLTRAVQNTAAPPAARHVVVLLGQAAESLHPRQLCAGRADLPVRRAGGRSRRPSPELTR